MRAIRERERFLELQRGGGVDGWNEDMDWIGLMDMTQNRDTSVTHREWMNGLMDWMAQRDHMTRNKSSTMLSQFSLSLFLAPTFLIMLIKKLSFSF